MPHLQIAPYILGHLLSTATRALGCGLKLDLELKAERDLGVACLLWKHEDPSSVPQHPHEKLGEGSLYATALLEGGKHTISGGGDGNWVEG